VTVPGDSLFARLPFSDTVAGIILLAASLAMLISCLVCLSKLLGSMLRGRLASLIKKTLNADFPGRLSFLTGYLAIVVGMGLTILVQSSSVFTSALTPLVGIGALTVERMYPLTLGSNIGTTTTGLLAAMACSGNCAHSLQIALCHLFFNLTGILLFFPVPAMRWPIGLSKMLGNTTARFRWFAIFYVIAMFFLAPAIVFGLSMVKPVLCFAVVGSFFVLVAIIVIINTLQRKRPSWLPKCLRTWDFLPLWMHSLEPLDRALTRLYACFAVYCCCCCCCCKKVDTKLTRVKQEYKSGASTATPEPLPRLTAVTAFRSPMFKGNSRFHDVPSNSSIMPLMTISPKPSAVDLAESGYVSASGTPSASLAGSHLKIPTLQ
jgi:sodium-dependent phosphate cotransporter